MANPVEPFVVHPVPGVTAPRADEPVVSPLNVPPLVPLTPVQAGVQQLQEAQADPVAAQRLNISNTEGNTLGQDNVVWQDYNTLNGDDFIVKYGPDVANMAREVSLGNLDVQQLERSRTRTGQDMALNVAGGFVQAVGGVGTAIVGLGLDPLTGRNDAVAMSKALGEVSEFTNNLGSDGQKNTQTLEGIKSGLDAQDSQIEYEKDKAENPDSWMPEFRKIGRDILNTGGRLANDPSSTGIVVEQGIGSLFAAGPIGKGIGLASAGIRTLAGIERVALSATASAAERAAFTAAAEKAAELQTTAAITLMESGGAYAQTAQDVLTMNHDDLKKGSDDYVRLYDLFLDQGMSPEKAHEEARADIASSAAFIAGGLTAPFAAVSGRLVAGFEAGPLRLGGLRQAFGNMAKETVEEASQSGVSQLATNVGIQQSADENRSISEGVGDQIVQGAIGGLGAAGVASAPSLVMGTANKAMGAGISTLSRATAVNQQKANAADIVRTTAAADAVAQNAPAVVEDLRTLVTAAPPTAAPVDPEAVVDPAVPAANPVEDFLTQVGTISQLPQEELDALPAKVQETIKQITPEGQTPNRQAAIRAAAAAVVDPASTPEERLAGSNFIADQLAVQDDLLANSESILENVDRTAPEFQSFAEMNRFLNTIAEHPAIKQALNVGHSVETNAATAPITDETVATPAGQQTVSNSIKLAQYAPQSVSPAVVGSILEQSDKGTVQLTTAQKKILQAVQLLHAQAAAQAANGQLTTQDIVSRNVKTDDGNTGRSLSTYVQEINKATGRGDTAGATRTFRELADFAQHFVNKANAFIASGTNNGQDTPFEALAKGKWFTDKKGVFYRPGNANSDLQAKRVQEDGQELVNFVNELAQVYPELGVQPMTMPDIAGTVAKATAPAVETAPVLDEVPALNTDVIRTLADLDVTNPVVDDSTEMEIVEPIAKEAPIQEDPAPVQEQIAETVENAPVEEQAPEAKPVGFGRRFGQGTRVVAAVKSEVIEKEPEKVIDNSSYENTAPVEDEATRAERKGPIRRMFPKLFDFIKAGGNFFYKAFTVPETERSRMGQFKNPLARMNELLTSMEGVQEFLFGDNLKGRLSYTPTKENLEATTKFLEKAKEIAAVLNKNLNEGKGLELLQKAMNGVDAHRFQNGRLLNLVEQQEDGSWAYNAQLLETAILSTLHWAATNLATGQNLDKTTAARTFAVGINDISDAALRKLNSGMGQNIAVRSMGDSILQFWGLTPNGNTAIAYTRGIVDSLSGELMAALEDVGMVQNTSVYVGAGDTLKSVNILKLDLDIVAGAVKDMGKGIDVVADLMVVDRPTVEPSFGKPHKDVAKFQMRNGKVRNTRQQRQALEAEQATPFKINMKMAAYMESLGAEGFLALMGGRRFEEGTLNQEHENNLNGINDGLLRSYHGVMNLIAAARSQVDENGNAIPLEDVEVYFAYNMSRVGRMQMLGQNNPQSDKLAREIFMPTRSVLDMTKPDSVELFWLTIAQGLGLKTEKKYHAALQAEAEALIRDHYAEVVATLQEHQGDLSKPLPADLVSKLQAAALKAGNGPLSMHGMHSLMAVAQLQNTDAAGLTEFEHFNYFEADGKTNGPLGALMLLATGPFTTSWMSAVAKGGVFVGREGQTLNDYIQTEDAIDLYGDGSQRLGPIQQQFMEDLKNYAPNVVPKMKALLRLMSSLNADITFTENSETGEISLNVKRGVMKNPLTITIYGSGIDGIAGNVADELVAMIYEKFSDVMASTKSNDLKDLGDFLIQPKEGSYGYAEFVADFRALSQETLAKETDPDLKGVFTIKHGKPRGAMPKAGVARSAKEFRLTAGEYEALRSHIRVLLVDQVDAAIKETVMGHVSPATQGIQKATHIQSIVVRNLFQNAMLEKLAEKKVELDEQKAAGKVTTTYREGDFLSQSELDAITNDLTERFPDLTTGTQTFSIGSSERAELPIKSNVKPPKDLSAAELKAWQDKQPANSRKMEITLGSGSNGQKVIISVPTTMGGSLADRYRSSPTVSGPTLAGVTAVPSTVIGMGDGMMMQIAALVKQMTGTMKVFDGINFSADKIREYGPLMNQATAQAWTGNPVRMVADQFRVLMRSGAIREMLSEGNYQIDEFVSEISKTIQDTYKPKSLNNEADILAYMDAMMADLDSMANEIDARHNTLLRVRMSYDQMAGTMNSYTQEGEVFLDANGEVTRDPEIIKDRLNEIYLEELAKVNEAVQTDQKKLVDAIATIEETNVDGNKILAPNAIGSFVKAFIGVFPDAVQGVAQAAIERLQKQGYTIVFGPTKDAQGNDAYGTTDTGTKTIHVHRRGGETLLHEMIHGATFDKVWSYFNKEAGKALDQADVDAIQRIEGLMDQFLTLDLEYEDTATIAAFEAARAAIQGHIDAQSRALEAKDTAAWEIASAAAVNEFMAWALANEHLAGKLAATRANPVLRIIQDVVQAIKDWLFNGKGPSVGKDMLSNLRFNTQILMATPSPSEMAKIQQVDARGVMLYQSTSFGQDNYLTEVRDRYMRSIGNTILDAASLDEVRDIELKMQTQYANQSLDQLYLANQFADTFGMDMQTKSTFHVILNALGFSEGLNANSLAGIQEMFVHVTSKLKPEDFMTDATSANPNFNAEFAEAQDKLKLILGEMGTTVDGKGRSSLLPAFLALAMTDKQFREILAAMEKPAALKQSGQGVDGFLTNAAVAAMDTLGRNVSGEGRAPNVLAALDAMNRNLTENVGDQRNFIEKRTRNVMDTADDLVGEAIQRGSNGLIDVGKALASKDGAIKRVGQVIQTVASLINEDALAGISEDLTSKLNKMEGWRSFREFMSDIIMTRTPLGPLISRSKAMVQAVAQQYREDLPKKLERKFNRKLSKVERSAMHAVMGKTDLALLWDITKGNTAEVLELISDSSKLSARITALEAQIQAKVGSVGAMNRMRAKALETAKFMVNGSQAVNLLPNAYAVAHMFDEVGAKKPDAALDLVPLVDELITLQALQQTSDANKNAMSDLIVNQTSGVEFVLATLSGIRATEMSKIVNEVSRINHFKGNIPAEAKDGTSLIVANDVDHQKLVSTGYVKVGPYNGSSVDGTMGAKSYYFSPVSGRATFNQGTMQTVRQTVFGIDPTEGFSVGPTAGRITDPRKVSEITKRLRRETSNNENLRPIRDRTGEIVAYERGMDPKQLERLRRNTDLLDMIGSWRGRQAEEAMAAEFNRTVVDKIHGMWVEAQAKGKTAEYVNLANSKDAIEMDSWRLVPDEIKSYIEMKYGKNGGFMVRRDLVNDALGYRSASVGDIWTGNSRFNEATRKNMETALTTIFGTKAFSYLVGTERFVQNLVTDAKVLIVVKSVIVPAANLVSNVYQLMNRGVPLRNIFGGLKTKTAELNGYINRRSREVSIEAEMAASSRDAVKMRRLEVELQSIKDANKRMTIWPLIEAGEFSSVSGGAVTVEDVALANGRWGAFVEGISEKLPGPARDAYRTAFVTRDSALFQGLARATAYGDFLAKAILYDDLMGRKGAKQEDALLDVNEEYVNYNKLSGRGRQYLESIGLLWFYNFKLRSTKVALKTLRTNPVRSLLAVGLSPEIPVIGGVGSPITDNIFSIGLRGGLGHSIGPMMGFGAPHLNPWLQIFGR